MRTLYPRRKKLVLTRLFLLILNQFRDENRDDMKEFRGFDSIANRKFLDLKK